MAATVQNASPPVLNSANGAIEMTRPLLGVVAGGILGVIDGMSAWFYPEARSMMVTIILGSTRERAS